jgi:3-hydroxymyristoyl/3-hydroxydecanoyl-(acyl carrier protein) dehydratase
MTATYALPLAALDRYQLVSDHEIVATKLARDDGGYLSGHYPGSLIYPGMFMLESITQAVRTLVDSVQPRANPRVRLTAVPLARFLAPVVAGDLLTIQCRCRYPAADLIEVNANCRIEDTAVAQLRCSFRLDPAEHG